MLIAGRHVEVFCTLVEELYVQYYPQFVKQNILFLSKVSIAATIDFSSVLHRILYVLI